VQYSYLDNRVPGGIAADDRYWEGLEEGRFLLPRCPGCQRWIWPAHWRCGECGSWEIGWEDVEPVGTVYAWTRTWYSFDRIKERADQIPYVVVLAEIPAAGGTRVLGVLKGDESGLRIGAPVAGEIDPPAPAAKGYATIRWKIAF
jgi:uncharacterized OB-fold protein